MVAIGIEASRRGWRRGRLGTISPAGNEFPQELLRFLRDKPRTLAEISTRFDKSEDTVRGWIERLRAAGYNVVETAKEVQVSTTALPDREPLAEALIHWAGLEVVLALVSDTHFGSRYMQISHLRTFLQIALERGARHVLWAGDITAGVGVYPGQSKDLFLNTGQEQVEVAAEVIPRAEELLHLGIGGNHDYSFLRRLGPDPLHQLALLRPDFRHLGYDVADVRITDKADVRLWHPSGGLPYAVSYRLQRGMEAAAFEELQKAITHQENPRLRLVVAGHLHVSMMLPIGGVYGFQAGCFEGQTDYLKRKGRFPEIGGWILRLRLADDGTIQPPVIGEWYRFTEIVDDWKRVERAAPREKPMETLFRVEVNGE
jgi:hypothetical protein